MRGREESDHRALPEGRGNPALSANMSETLTPLEFSE